MVENNIREVPEKYKQPDLTEPSFSRVVRNSKEQVKEYGITIRQMAMTYIHMKPLKYVYVYRIVMRFM